MANDETIAGVNIGITGDFSDLDKSFDAAKDRAVSDSQAIAAAIQSVLSSVDMSGVAASFNQLSDGAKAATASLKEIADGAAATKQGVADLGSELEKFAGTLLTAAGIKQLGEAAMDAADSFTRASISLGAITEDGQKAAEVLKQIDDLGMHDGLSLPALRDAAVSLKTILPEGTDVVATLGHIADGAAQMNTSISSAVTKFETLIETGNLSVKTLRPLGLTIDDIGTAMENLGVPAATMASGIKEAFAALDQTQQVEVATEALNKLKGVAEQVGNETFGGLWTKVANQFEIDLANMTGSAAPLTDTVLPAIKAGMQDVFAAATLVSTGIKVVIDSATGLLQAALSGITGYATALGDALTGDFRGAITAAQSAFNDIKSAGTFAWDSIVKDSQAGADALKGIFADTGSSAKTASDGVDKLTGSIGQTKTQMADAAAAAKEFASEIKTTNSALDEVNTVFGNVEDSYDKYVQDLSTGGKTATQQLGEVNKAIDDVAKKMLTLKDPTLLAGLQEWAAKLNDAKQTLTDFAQADAWNKLSGQIAGLAAKFPQQVGEMTGSLKDFVTQALITADTVPAAMNKVDAAGLIGKWLEAQKQLDDQTQKMGDHFTQAMNKYEEGVQNEVIPITATMQERLSNLDTTFQGLAAHSADAFKLSAIADYLNTVKQLNDAGFQTIQQQEAQNQKLADTVNKLIAVKGAYGDILKAQADWLQNSITLAEKEGKDANDLVLGLEKVNLQIQANALASHGFADIAVKGINDIISGFDQLAGAMADAIVNGKNMGDALIGVFKKIAQSILTDLIQASLVPLKKDLLDLISKTLPDLGGAITDTGKGIELLGETSSQASDAMKSLHDAVNAAADGAQGAAKALGAVGDSTGKGASGLAGAVSGLTSVIGIITEIVSAGAAVASTILLSHISSDTGHIEVNTRETFAQVTNIWETLKSDFEQTYNRDGEMLDRLNHIMDSTAAIAAAGPGGSASGMSADAINKIAGNSDDTVTILGNTYSLTQSILAAVQTSANDLNWIQTGSDNIFHELGVIADLLTEMYQVMLYGKSFSASSESAAASQRAVATESLHSLVAQSITGNTIGRTVAGNTAETASDAAALYAPLLAQVQAAEDSLRHASDTDAQLTALRSEYAAYEQLANAAHMQGDEMLAQQYGVAANAIAARISGIAPQVQTAMVSALEGTDMTLVNASKGIEFSQLAGAQLISTTVAQGSMLVASSVSTAVANTAAASAQFASSLTSSLINIRGSLSSAGSTPLPLNSQGAQTPLSVAGPSNGLPPLPMTGHMGYATGGAIQTDQTAQLHAGEVVVPAVQVASQSAQMSAQATQIQDLQAQLAGLNITLQQSLAAGDVKGSENAQGAVSDMQAKLDALTAAMQANTAATATSAAGTDGTTSADATLQQIAMLNQQQLMAQNQLAIAQKTGNAQLIQASQDQLDQVNAKLSLLQTQQAPVATASSQMADLMKQQADLQKTLIAAEQTGNTALVTMTQKQLGDIGTQLDQLKVAQVNAGTASTTPTAAESAMLSQSQGDQSGALASLQDQVAQGIAKIQASASSSDPMAAMLAMQQANAQQALSVAQSGGNPQAIQAMQAQLDQINQKISVNSGGATSSGALGSLDSNGLFVPPSAADYKSASLAAESLNTTDMSAAPDLSGLSSSSGFMDTTGIIDAIKAETDTLHSDLMNLATSLGVSQKWGVSASKVKSFDSGGPVMEDQLAMVHAGEFVVPPDVTGMLRSMASAPRAGYGTDPGSGGGSSGNGGGGGVVVNAPITITGVTDGRQLATMLEQHLKRVLSRTGKYTK